VDRVKAFGLVLGHVDAPGSEDAKSGLFKHLGDSAGQVAAGRIGFDDREGTFGRHGRQSSID
jgi:hypothetical protein